MKFPANRVAAAALLAFVASPFATLSASAAVTKQLPFSAQKPMDLGVASSNSVKSVTLGLKIVDKAKLEAYIASTTDRKSPNFRKFLTPAQFRAAYGQSDAAVARVTAYLKSQGVTVTKVFSNNLFISVKATNAQLAGLFGSPIHGYQLAGKKYEAPTAGTSVPAALADVVGAVAGLSTQPMFWPHHTSIPNVGKGAVEAAVGPHKAPTPKAAATGIPGEYTVADLAAQYNVNPLYARGITGKNVTLAILTLAGFDPADAYAYWSAIGLSVDPTRITRIPVDGGSGDGAGSDETTLDVEQSGGLAPAAKILVYEAPNTDSGFIDLFAQAVTENKADTMSVSWGSAEITYDPASLDMYNAVFMQAAAQGTPLTAATGDAGAYDINRSYAYPGCSTLLSVDQPAASPYMFGAGGTTLPGVIPRKLGSVTVPVERPWAWDYLRDYYVKNYGQAYYYANLFPVGGGGGVSVNEPLPSYQASLPGTKTSQGGQSLFCTDSTGVYDLVDLPVGVAGRNLPDVALNADPFTGYSVYVDGGWIYGYGGTSFVAPQLNGIFALLTEELKGRVGFPQPQFYAAFKAQGYAAGSPFRPITSGDDLFYPAGPYYNPASGLGALDIDNLSKTLSAK